MNHAARNGATSPPSQPARAALDSYFLEARARLLDLAAILDRISRAPGSAEVESDPRLLTIRDALAVLHDESSGRAERIQQLFSLDYDAEWARPQPR